MRRPSRRRPAKLEKRVEVKSQRQLRAWLKANWQRDESIWLVTYKKGSEHHLPYNVIVEEALCFGWIDSLPRALDERRTMIRLSPRSPKSAWSKLNRDRVAKLMEEGRMMAPGLAAVSLAKANGTWSKLQAIDGNRLPPDLRAALRSKPTAQRYFEAFPPSTKRAILEWILQAKRPETRASRIEKTVTLAQQNLRANQIR